MGIAATAMLLLSGCQQTAVPPGSTVGGPSIAASEASVREIATQYSACAFTAISGAGEATCLDQGLVTLSQLSFPAAMHDDVAVAIDAGKTAGGCLRPAAVGDLARCRPKVAAFFADLTDLEYSMATGGAPASAPSYWSLDPTPSLVADQGQQWESDSMSPVGPDWPTGPVPGYGGWSSPGRILTGSLSNQTLIYNGTPFQPVAQAMSVEITATVSGTAQTDVGVGCRSSGTKVSYYFLVSTAGNAQVDRSGDSTGQLSSVASAVNDSLKGTPTVTVEGVCITLSLDGGIATNRLILFVNGSMALDTTDVARGQTSKGWSALLAIGGDAGASASYRDAVVRVIS